MSDNRTTAGHKRASRGSRAGSCLKALGAAMVALFALGVLGIVWIDLSLQQPEPPKPEIVPAQVRLSSAVANVSDSAPVAKGHVKIQYDKSTNDFVAGLSLGWPVIVDSAPPTVAGSPGRPHAPFQDPLVRMSVNAPGARFATSCLGPCEIARLNELCTGHCALDLQFQVELLSDADYSGPIQCTVTIAGSVEPGEQLPNGVSVSVTFEGETETASATESPK